MKFSRKVISAIFGRPPLRRAIFTGSMSGYVEASPSASSGPLIPETVRGMTELDRERFRSRVTFPVVSIDAKDCTPIRTKLRLEKFLLRNLVNIKNVMDDPSDRTKKFLVFDPASLNDETKSSLEIQIGNISGKETKFSEREIEIGYENLDLRRVIRAVLPEGLDFSSFTQSGHLVHCNFRDEIAPFKKVVAQVIADKVKNCKTVVNKLDCIKSTYRNFELELLAGEPNYEVEVLEGGLRYRLDFSKVFWNTRLSHEHERVLKQLDSRSLVYDACAGVGPFALPAAKKKYARKILANDLNPESAEWMRKNRALNKIKNEDVVVHNMDAIEFIRGPVADDIAEEISKCMDPEWTPPSGAHVIMNLPAYSVNFLPAFRGILRGKVSVSELPFKIVVYCYLFTKAHEEVPDDWYEKKAREMVAEKLSWNSANVLLAHHVRTVSSRKEMFCMQIEIPLDLLTAEPLEVCGGEGTCDEGNGVVEDGSEKEPPQKRPKNE